VSVLPELQKDWPLFAVVVVLMVVSSTGLGWLLARLKVLPGTTAVWGASPGAAAAMTLMSEAYGADMRLVAFMQYQRVVFVATLASVVAALWAVSSGHIPQVVWFPSVNWPALAATLAVAAIGGVLGKVLRVPAGALMGPLILGVILQGVGLLTVELPPWLLALCYAVLGWTIGLRFTRAIIAHAARAMPRVVAAQLTLIAFCAGIAVLLVVFMGIDPLTAYLATSPGGADTVAIIAASSNVDVPFVMAMQASRLFVVMLAGPALTRFVASRFERRRAARD
jgi:membrane AbrB-like protein